MSWTKTRSQIANTKRRDPGADVTDLRRQLKAERLEDRIRSDVETWPELTPEQRDRLAQLLRGGGDDPPGSARTPSTAVRLTDKGTQAGGRDAT